MDSFAISIILATLHTRLVGPGHFIPQTDSPSDLVPGHFVPFLSYINTKNAIVLQM